MINLKNSNPNYSAQVVKIHNLIEAENSDNLLIFPIMGMSCIVSKNLYKVGDIGIVFPCESQLCDDLCRSNNLYRHSELNKNQDLSGYLEDNKRVRAIKLRGNNSNALFLPLSCLDYLGIDTGKLKEGDSFTHINGKEIVRKYVIKAYESNANNRTKGKNKIQYVDPKIIPEHHETPQFLRNTKDWKNDDYLYLTSKIHGTAVRLGHVQVKRKLNLIDKIYRFFGANIQETKYDYVAGSRRVIKYNQSNNNDYYSTDLYNENLEKIKHLIPKNWILYGEIIGWSNESNIQKNYTYRLPKGQNELYIYRISIVNEDGIRCDLTWPQVIEFCKNNNINHVPELWRGYFKDLNIEQYNDKKLFENGYNSLPLDDKSPCDEGVVLMKYGLNEYFAKYKFSLFYEHETKQIDSGKIDMESNN